MSPFSPHPLQHGQAGRIDALCDQFEKEWIAGGRPRLEELLPRAEERDRTALLAELLALELENRLARGERVAPEEYHQRLPDDTQLIDEVFAGLRAVLAVPGERDTLSQKVTRSQIDPTPRPGPRYQIEGLLGQGGMGVVYRAHDRLLGRTVALKVIRPDALNSTLRARFAAEARAVARLDHPHIIKIFDVGEMPAPDGSGLAPYLTLEYVPGGSLRERLCGPLKPVNAAHLVGLLARAMQHAHERGIVHRDLKPDNVLLAEPSAVEALNTPVGRPQITDFGLARVMDGEPLSDQSAPLGTPGYLAPEQAEGRPDVGPPADVHALGVILYRLLTGRMPFESDIPVQLLRQISRQRPLPLRQVCASVPAELERICLACLHKQPEQRPTAAELARQLERFCKAKQPMAIPGKQKAWRLTRRSWLLAGLGGAAVLGGVVGLRRLIGEAPGTSNPPRDVDVPEPLAVMPAEDPAGPSEPLQVVELKVKHFKNLGNRTVEATGVLGRHVFDARLGDRVELWAELSHPGYAWLLAYGPDGSEKLCFPASEEEAPPLTDRPSWPWQQRRQDWALEEGIGFQVFVVVASSRRLPPFEVWRAKRGKAPWIGYPATAGTVWRDDGGPLQALTALGSEGMERGVKDKVPSLVGLMNLRDWLRRQEGVEAVLAVGFAVLE